MTLIKRLAHASVLVAELDISLRFYCGVLGMTVDAARPDLGYPGAWLWAGEQQLHLLQLPNPDPRDGRPAHGGRDRHTAFEVTDIHALRTALDQAGVDYTLSRSGRNALFCRDPDGNALEFTQTP